MVVGLRFGVKWWTTLNYDKLKIKTRELCFHSKTVLLVLVYGFESQLDIEDLFVLGCSKLQVCV